MRARHEHQIDSHSTTFGREFERALWNVITAHRGWTWFTDEQIADIRREMIARDWFRHKLNRENRKRRAA